VIAALPKEVLELIPVQEQDSPQNQFT